MENLSMRNARGNLNRDVVSFFRALGGLSEFDPRDVSGKEAFREVDLRDRMRKGCGKLSSIHVRNALQSWTLFLIHLNL